MKKLLIAATLSAGFIMSGTASAAALLTTAEIKTFNFATLDAATTLSFSGFDASLGTLHSVHFSWTLDKTLNNDIININAGPSAIGVPLLVSATSTTNFSGSGVSGIFSDLNTLTTAGFSGSVAGGGAITTVGTASALGISGGTDFCDDLSCANAITTAELSGYIGGTNLFNIDISNIGSQGGSVPPGVFTGNTGDANGTFSIVYDYTAAVQPPITVAEPTSLALLGLSLVGFAAARRKKSA